MLQVLGFILQYVSKFIHMLFTIQVDNGLSLGLLMCIVFIFLPVILRIIVFIKRDALEELNDRYDESRPREMLSFTETQSYIPTTGAASRVYSSRKTGYYRRRMR